MQRNTRDGWLIIVRSPPDSEFVHDKYSQLTIPDRDDAPGEYFYDFQAVILPRHVIQYQ